MTFIEMFIDAIYEYVDRYIILDDAYLDDTSSWSDDDTDIDISDLSSDEDMTCTYTVLT